jgi:[acyl-carrier-protein] S-malonyltransferase
MVAHGRGGIAFVFPGQASQRAGMAAELLEREPLARAVFGRAGEVLGLDLAGVCTTGNEALLNRTDITQPALLTTCVAWHRVLRDRGVFPALVAGHSLGEFSAWVAAGAIDFEPCLRLVRRRGELMEEAATRKPGGMLAVIGLSDDDVIGLCEKVKGAGVVVPANLNAPGQLVVSGEPAALDRLAELVKAARGRVLPLRVSGAFHSPLMDDAAHEFSRLVADLPLADPHIPVVANVTAEPVTQAEPVRRAICEQMTAPVRWTDSVRRLVADGVELFGEIGPGSVLTKLIRRISADARCLSVGSPAELDTFLQEVSP